MKVDYSKKTRAMFPMPVILIGTYDSDGTPDVMNAAWGTLEDMDVVLIELTKDHMTSKNILERKCFTISFADRKNIEAADYVGIVSKNHDKDKFIKSGLHEHKGELVDAPVLEEFPITLECTLERIDETNGDFVVYGKIVKAWVDDTILDENGNIDVDKAELVSYCTIDHSYRLLGNKVADAFKVGNKLKA